MKKTLAVMFAASVATFGCNKSKTDTANPDEAKPTEGEKAPEGDKAAEEKPADSAPAEGGDAAAPTP